jgi:hypothetical protein
VLQILVSLIRGLIQVIRPVFTPLLLVFAWTLLFLVGWSVWAAVRDGIENAKQMHQIPCANCRFFTQNYHLKCPVHPKTALSEAAINCPDYEPLGIL